MALTFFIDVAVCTRKVVVFVNSAYELCRRTTPAADSTDNTKFSGMDRLTNMTKLRKITIPRNTARHKYHASCIQQHVSRPF